MIKRAGADAAIAMLDAMHGLSGWRRDDGSKALTDEVIGLLLGRAVPSVRDRFARPGGIASLGGSPHREVEGAILFRPEFGAYDGDGRVELVRLAEAAANDAEIHSNFLGFARLVAHGLSGRGTMDASVDELRALVKDRELVRVLWRGATSKPIPFRMHESVRRVKAAFEKNGVNPSDLPIPASLRG